MPATEVRRNPTSQNKSLPRGPTARQPDSGEDAASNTATPTGARFFPGRHGSVAPGAAGPGHSAYEATPYPILFGWRSQPGGKITLSPNFPYAQKIKKK